MCRTLTSVLACRPGLTQHSESSHHGYTSNVSPRASRLPCSGLPFSRTCPGRLSGQSPRAHFCRLLSSNASAPRKQAWPKADPGRWEPLVLGYVNPQLAKQGPQQASAITFQASPRPSSARGSRAGCDGWQGRLHPPAPVL